jgi:VWFA-related protein
MQKFGVPLVICLATLFAGRVAAQNAPPAEPGPAIRVTTTEVLLDLVVRDKHGRQVKNLKPEDVEIYEDGVRQKVLSFRQVASHEAQRMEAGIEIKNGQVAPGPGPRSLRAVNVVCIVFHNLDPVSRTRAIEAAQEFIRNDLQPETYVGVFSLNDRLTALHPFTNNRKQLIQAAQNAFNGRTMDFARASEAILTANPTQATIAVAAGARSANVTLQITGGEISKTTFAGADVSNDQGANIMRGEQVRERSDFSNIIGMRETDKIITMINEIGTLPGRKTVLLVTTGLVTTGDPKRFQSILDNANKLGVTVYALDTAGLSQTDTIQAGNNGLGQVASVSRTQATANSSLGAMKEKSRQNDNMNDAVRTSDTQASLRELSEGTGGFLIANTNEFRKPFQRIIEGFDAHYEAAYHPSSDRYDGHLRKVEVKLARADLQVESRTGYFAIPDLNGSSTLAPFESTALAVLNVRPLPHAFDFHSAAFNFQNDGTHSQNVLAFELPGASLVGMPEPEHKTHRFHVSLLALVKEASGQIVDRYSLDAPYQIPDANLPAVLASAITYTHPVSLPPGHYTVETAVVDREGGRSTANIFPLNIPPPRKGVGMSSVILVQQVEPVSAAADASDPLVFQGKRMVPMAAPALKPASKPVVYFVVYPDKANAEKPKIQVEFLADGQLLAKQTADLPPPDSSGTIPMIVGAAMRPGNCELRITALQGSESATERVTYTVAAN